MLPNRCRLAQLKNLDTLFRKQIGDSPFTDEMQSAEEEVLSHLDAGANGKVSGKTGMEGRVSADELASLRHGGRSNGNGNGNGLRMSASGNGNGR